MKIVIDVSQLAYTGHGVGRYMHDLVEALLRLPMDDVYTLYAGAWQNKAYFHSLAQSQNFRKAKWKLYPIPPRLAHPLFNQLNLPIEWFTGTGDVFHASDWTQPRTKMPSVTTIHDLAFLRYPETVNPLVRQVQETRLQRVVASGTHIIADSMSTKNDLMKEYKLASEKIDIVYPGVNKMFHKCDQKEIERVKNIYHIEGEYLLTVGTKEPRKNLMRTVAAYKKFAVHNPGMSLVMTGRAGWGEQVGDEKGLLTTGYVDDADLPALYSGAAAFLYPSLYEGFGFPVLEAMRCGTPVVTSNVSSLPELVGDAGIMVDPTDISAISSGITQALKNQKKLSVSGLRQASHFTWEMAAQQTRDVYAKLR